MKLIGLAGTDGSGKDTVGEILAEKGWKFISVTDLLRSEARNRVIRLGRDTLREISAEWRRQKGLGVLVDRSLEAHKNSSDSSKNLVIASLRNPGECDRVHELDGLVIWVDADPKVRYERIRSRKRGTEDEVSFKEFQAEEEAQMQHSGDEATLNLSGVRDKADVIIENNFTTREDFKSAIDSKLSIYY